MTTLTTGFCTSRSVSQKPWANSRNSKLLHAEKELDMKIKAVRTDRGSEYMSEEFASYLRQLDSVAFEHKPLLFTHLSIRTVLPKDYLSRTLGEAAR